MLSAKQVTAMIEYQKADAAVARLLSKQTPQAGVLYVPSQFAYPFTSDGKQFLYHTLTKQCVEAILPASCSANEGFDELIQGRFLVPSEQIEYPLYESVSKLLRTLHRKPGYNGYTILPTFACNARCVYCYEAGVEQHAMKPETVDQLIHFLLETHAKEELTLTWFGGEPLLCPHVIDRVSAALQEAAVPFHAIIVTNASLITPEILEKMTGAWKVKRVQVSMDGAEADYVARKRYRQDLDQYHTVIQAIDRMAEAGIQVTIRCNVDEQNIGSVPLFLEDLKTAITHKENVRFYLARLFQTYGDAHNPDLIQAIRDLSPAIASAGFQPQLGSTSVNKLRINHCMADGSGVVISPDGGIAACEHLPSETRYGDIWNGPTSPEIRAEFTRTDRTREKCRSCPFLPICTSFASCPNIDASCRVWQQKRLEPELIRLVQKKTSSNEEADDPSFC